MDSGLYKVGQERREQVTKHGHPVISDLKNYDDGELVQVAGLLVGQVDNYTESEIDGYDCPIHFDRAVFEKMMRKSYEERLVYAASLLCAEIDRVVLRKDMEENG